MGVSVVNGACIMCSNGMAPSSLMISPSRKVFCHTPTATIMDYIPNSNIVPFGMCRSLANPAVAAATTLALGVLTPQPCVPVTVAPWSNGSPQVLIGGVPALNNASTLTCAWSGVITITQPGQIKTILGK